MTFYNFLHSFRWGILAASLIALGVCSYFATTLTVPNKASDFQLLVDTIQYEQAGVWRQELFSTELLNRAGGQAGVIWGVTPADTGDHMNPYTWTTLELDETFDPSSKEAQVFMRDYCENFFAQEFAEPETPGYVCGINQFDEWLQVQSLLPAKYQNLTYVEHCSGATAMPVDPDIFHPCLSAWAQQEEDQTIISRDGVVRIVHFSFASRTRFNSPITELNHEWHLIEDWMRSQEAPAGVANGYFSSLGWLFWDTQVVVYETALWSGGFAIAVASLVILISSRSLSMTFFSALSVAFVLVSVSSIMSACGWTLGFLECLCFTILIGLSGDFVLHFSHAYCELPGNVNRHIRTKYALTHLGPSILAAGLTTFAGALIMFFTHIHFFRLFAMVLFCTILQATIGSFVFFLVLTDCFGPSTPTVLIDSLTSKFVACYRPEEATQSQKGDQDERPPASHS